MADEPQQIRGINWRETFPFTHLFRAFRVAVHPSKLMLGLIALLALYAGGRLLDTIWSPRHLAVPPASSDVAGPPAAEVHEYERTQKSGGTSSDFSTARLRGRENVEQEYVALLGRLNIETDAAKAAAYARDAKKLGDVKDKIKLARDQQVNRIEADYSQALAAAKAISDKSERSRAEHAAEATRDNDRRAAYADAYADWTAAKRVKGVGLFHAFFAYEAERIVGVVYGVMNGNWVGHDSADNRGRVLSNIKDFFVTGPMWLMRHHPLYFVCFTILFLTVWAIFGGAIARIAAVHVARDEKLSVRAALAFSLGKFFSFVSAPLIPLVIVLIVGLVPLIAGVLSSFWYVGPIFNILMGILFVLILGAGFVMTLVLLGTFGGFNLMYPTIAVEGSDSFDAISRSFSYVYARPWRMLLYTLVAVVYGALCYLFVRLFIWMMLSLTHHFVGAGMWVDAPSMEPLWTTMWRGPSAPPGRLSYDIDFLSLRWDQKLAAGFISFWVYLAVGMLGAFAISFYFTANTIIYYLMRHEVDATELDDVYVEQSEEDFADATAPPASASAVLAEKSAAAEAAMGTTSTAPVAGDPAPPAPPSSSSEPPPT